MWIPLVETFGGTHHGYFMPHENANNIALALRLRPTKAIGPRQPVTRSAKPLCASIEETKCFISYERSFMRPVFE